MNAEFQPPAATVSRTWVLVVALWLLIALPTATALWQLRKGALQSQGRELDLLSLALADKMDQGLQGVEEGVRALRGELQEAHLPAGGSDLVATLRRRAELMPLVSSLWLLDGQGRLLAASDATLAPVDLAFAPELRTLAPDAVALSRLQPGAPAAVPMAALAMRLPASPSGGDAWIVAGLSVGQLLGAFGKAVGTHDARMAVFHRDGSPFAGGGTELFAVPSVARPDRPEAGTGAELRQARDGRQHLVSQRDLARHGLAVVASRERSAVLGEWRTSVEVACAGLAVVLVAMAAAVRFGQHAARRRRDVQRLLQTQLARATKLQALGSMAGGVAHDFNSVLAGIQGWSEMALEAAPAGSDQARHLGNVLTATRRGRALAARVLAFSRGGSHASLVFEIEPVIREVLALVEGSHRSGIELAPMLQAPGALLRGDPNLVYEAVMNLCTNALQAMSEGGRLEVRLERCGIAEPRVLSHSTLVAGHYLVVTVSDQGTGITGDVMERLFEPFFTTRGDRQGTGLGLAVVHGVVTELQGAIDVQSPPGQGARFSLYLPECEDAVEADSVHRPVTPMGHGQRVLVVDDDPVWLGLLVEMLNALGYEPVGMTDAAQAQRVLATATHGHVALIVDQVMPGVSGLDLALSVRRAGQPLPVLLVTGLGGEDLAQQAADAGVLRVLSKPVRARELAEALDALWRAAPMQAVPSPPP